MICFHKLSEDLLKILAENEIKSVKIEAEYMTVARLRFFRHKLEAKGITVSDGSELDKKIAGCRIIKDETELEKIRTAQKIAENAARLEFLMKMNGAEDISFDLITITGKKTSLPHGVPSDAKIAEGDFFTCDFGAVYEGYHSDTTRTVAVGHATEEMREIYTTVLNAQLSALDVVKAGVPAADVDRAARKVIDDAGYGKYFGHATGHGVGLDIHESPAVSYRGNEILRAGMIITDEPGIYLPDRFGVRIEDMLCVTDTGYENLVSLPKELIIL